jgi:hypothetical protein
MKRSLALICISLAKGIEHLFGHLLGIFPGQIPIQILLKLDYLLKSTLDNVCLVVGLF